METPKPLNEYAHGDIMSDGSIIKEIVIQTKMVIIYMDSNDSIAWETESGYIYDENFPEIQNKISYWASIANKIFSKKEAYNIKLFLAEGYSRILDNQNIVAAREVIEQCKTRIIKNGCEILKQAYAFATLFATCFCLLMVLSIRFWKDLIIYNYSNNVYEILQTMAFGGIGAFVFTTIRLQHYVPEIVVGKGIHRLDGLLRVFYGIIAGLIVAVAIKSNIAFGFLNKVENTIYVSIFLGVIAGASEVLIPNLIKQVDAKVAQGNANKEGEVNDNNNLPKP